jgi:hypothetical protein
MKKSVAILLMSMMMVLMLMPVMGIADVYMKQRRQTDAFRMMGTEQPAVNVVEEIWITPKGVRTDNPEMSTIMLPDEQKIIMIDHQSKTYVEQSTDLAKMMEGMPKDEGAGDHEAMHQMMQQMTKMDVSVTDTGEEKVINGWKSRKYLLAMNTMMGKNTTEIWATEDLKIDKKLYDQLMTKMFSGLPGMQASMETIQKEMEKVKGVQVLSIFTMDMMNQTHKTRTELLEFKPAEASKDLFAVPTGYRQESPDHH